MFLKLKHQDLDVYKVSKQLVLESYSLTKLLPTEERYGIASQIRRASLSILLNIAEGAARISNKESKRFYEIARSSVVEVDAAFEVCTDLKYFTLTDLKIIEPLIVRTFQMLSKMV